MPTDNESPDGSDPQISAPAATSAEASGSANAQREPASPAFGRRQAFDDVTNPLTPEDLQSPGTQKLLIYLLGEEKSRVETLKGYVERFHDAEKRSAILNEKLEAKNKVDKAVERAVTTGTSLGGLIAGVAFYFFGKTTPDYICGWVALVIGIAMMIGAALVKK